MLIISRVAALFLLFMYAQLIAFQLVTHKHLFQAPDGDHEEEDGDEDEVRG